MSALRRQFFSGNPRGANEADWLDETAARLRDTPEAVSVAELRAVLLPRERDQLDALFESSATDLARAWLARALEAYAEQSAP